MKLFRKGGLVLLLIIALIFSAGIYFFTDGYIESQLEETLSKVNGALVEFDDFSIGFFSGDVSWNKLQVADADNLLKNKVETGRVVLSVQAWKLLQKKVIIEEVALNQLQFGTERAYSGILPKKWLQRDEKGDNKLLKFTSERTELAKKSLKSEVEKQPLFQLANASVNVDSLISILKLSAPTKIDSLKNSISTQITAINQSVDALKVSETSDEIQTKVKAIDVKNIKDLKTLDEAKKSVESLNTSVKQAQDKLKQAQSEIEKGKSLLDSGKKEVPTWIAEDYKQAQNAAKLPDLDTQKIGELLLGKELMEKVTDYLGYAETARTYLAQYKSEKPEKELEPERLKGQDISFRQTQANPDFWLKKMNVSFINATGITFSGLVSDIVSNQKSIDAPTRFEFSGKNKLDESLSVQGEFNYLGEQSVERFSFAMPKLSLRTLNLGGSGSLPNGFSKGNGDVNASLEILDGAPDVKITMENTDVTFQFDKNAAGKTEKLFRDILAKINRFNVIAEMKSQNGGMDISIDSDIDNQISKQLKASASKEIEKAKKQIQAKVDEQINAKKKQLDELITEKKQQLEAQKKKIETTVHEKLAEVEQKKKELEAKKEELMKQGTDKVKEAIKGKIKF